MSPCRLNAATNDLSGLLQKGLFEEEANRNLDAAVQAYQALVTAFDQDRKLAATAVFRLGECYRKLGKTNEAVLQYDRIVREFIDETTLTTLSRQNLAGLGAISNVHPVATPILADVQSPEKQELDRLTRLSLQLSGLDFSQIRKLLPTLVPDTDFENLERQLSLAERGFPSAQATHGDEARERLNKLEASAKRRAEEVLKMLTAREAELRMVVEKQRERQHAALATSAKPAAAAADDEEARQLAAKLQSLERLKDDPEKQAQAVLALFPDEDLKKMLLHLPKLQSQEARFKADPNFKPNALTTAVGPGLVQDLTANFSAAEAWAELKKQLTLISERVNFILGLQRARLQVLQSTATTANVTKTTSAAVVVDDEETEIRRLQALLQNSPDLKNATSGNDQLTPLCRAAGKGQLRVAGFLLDQGAEVNRKANANPSLFANFGEFLLWTPLHFAVFKGHKATAELLLMHGAALSVQDDQGRTPLHLAADRGFREVAASLIASGADLNAPDKAKETPLHLAAANGQVEVIRLLIAEGADLRAWNLRSLSPFDVARMAKQPTTVVDLLRAPGTRGGPPLSESAEPPERP